MRAKLKKNERKRESEIKHRINRFSFCFHHTSIQSSTNKISKPKMIFGLFQFNEFIYQIEGPLMALLRSPQFIFIEFLFNSNIASFKQLNFWFGIGIFIIRTVQ